MTRGVLAGNDQEGMELIWNVIYQYGRRGADSKEIIKDIYDGNLKGKVETRRLGYSLRAMERIGMIESETYAFPGKKEKKRWIAIKKDLWDQKLEDMVFGHEHCSPKRKESDDEHEAWLAGVRDEVAKRRLLFEANARF